MTLLTLVIHRIRQSRAERRERAPEVIVASLPTGVWTGEGLVFDDLEKEAGVVAHPEAKGPASSCADTIAERTDASVGAASMDHDTDHEDDAVEAGVEPNCFAAEERAASLLTPPASAPEDTELLQEQRIPSNLNDETTLASSSKQSVRPRAIANGRKYLKKAWFATQTECAICLGDFEKGDKLRILPCGHVFHVEEVDAWLIRRRKLVKSLVLSQRLHPADIGLVYSVQYARQI